jgi:hypothetical protein
MNGVALTTHDGSLILDTLPIEKSEAEAAAEEPPKEEPPAAS